MKYRIHHTTKYAYSEPVPVCQNKVRLAPLEVEFQKRHDYRLVVVPEPETVRSEFDYFGNHVDYFALADSHRHLAVTSSSQVEVTRTPMDEPPESPPWETVAANLAAGPPRSTLNACLFAYNSQYVQREAELAEYARGSFSTSQPIFDACLELTNQIYNDFEYKPQVTNISTPVSQVFKQRKGVCQDFAHLQIACLRSLGLAARYVSGYLRTIPPPGKPRLVGADASHAWVSVFCGPAGWVDFDPTNNVIPASDHISIALGRDYGDVCPIQGIFVGGGDHTMSVSVDVEPLES